MRLTRKQVRLRAIDPNELDPTDYLFLTCGGTPGVTLTSWADCERFYQEHRRLFVPRWSQQGGNSWLMYDAGERSAAWWSVDAPEQRDHRIPETEQLHRLGLIDADEMSELRKHSAGAHLHYWRTTGRPAFRRAWIWWHDTSAASRNYDITETQQLVESDQLTHHERTLLAGPRVKYDKPHGDLSHLAQTERDYVFERMGES